MSHLPDILQSIVAGLAQGSIYAIVAVGFTIIFSCTEVVNFAQGEFVMIGAMTSYGLIAGLGWHWWCAVPVAILVALVVGMALGWIIMRPLKNASVPSLIIITVGASMLLQGFASQLWGKDAVNVNPYAAGVLLWQLPHTPYPVAIEYQKVLVMGVMLLIVLALTLFFNLTMTGKAMRAVAVNRHGARLIGVNVSRMVIGAFALSAAIGAAAGAVIVPLSSGQFNMGTMLGLKGFAAAIVGGLGNFPGSIIAGLLLGVLEKFGAYYISSDYKDAFAFIILLVVLITSPQGLLAFRRRRAG